ncbi:hypothetical protein [Streptomyces sp. x-80]|uniref:hypothetical protein n=1 Tax=Streptomyces sp. x-80 TaxID=2789282 RepID=UPI0039809829
MRRLARIGLLSGFVSVLALSLLQAIPGESRAAPNEQPAGDDMPYAVEDFNYPNADKIFAEKGITLKRGDGHITLASCVSEQGLLEVWSRKNEKVCFRVTGNSGYLTLEIPQVFGFKGNDYQTTVDMTVVDTGEEKSFDIRKNTWTPVGETADTGGDNHTLVEISTKK